MNMPTRYRTPFTHAREPQDNPILSTDYQVPAQDRQLLLRDTHARHDHTDTAPSGQQRGQSPACWAIRTIDFASSASPGPSE